MSTVYNKKTAILNKGFSLIEMMVYLAVTVLVAGALITTFLSLDTVLVRNKTERVLTQSATVSLERMVRDIRSADSVNSGLSIFESSPGALAVVSGATTTRLYVSGGKVMVSVNGAEVGPLTSDAVTVESLTFHHYTGTVTEMVRAELTLSVHSKAASSTRAFYTSAVLRGTYE